MIQDQTDYKFTRAVFVIFVFGGQWSEASQLSDDKVSFYSH